MPSRVEPDDYPGLEDGPVADIELEGPDETRRLGRWLARRVDEGDLIGLIGDLGAGKTTLVQGLVDELDETGDQRATSPTYALIQVYETVPRVHHIDLYRLEGWADLESIGYWDVVDAPRGVSCVEWLDRIPGAWPGRGAIVELVDRPDGRTARLFGDAQWAERLNELTRAKLRALQPEEQS